MAKFENSQKQQWLETIRKVEKAGSAPLDPFSEQSSGLWSSEIEAFLDSFSLKNLYYSEPWVYIIIQIVAKKISKQFMSVWMHRLVNGERLEEPAENHPLMAFIDHPNQYESYTPFMNKLVSELALMGNCVIWKLRFHRELILLPSELVTIEFDKNNQVEWYRFNNTSSADYGHFANGDLLISPEDIIHVRLPNINSMLWGLSPFIAGKKSLLFERYSSEYLLNFYLKQANPGPVLEMEKEANEKQAFRFLKSMEENWTGRRNARRTMILPKGVKAKSLSQTLAEQELREHILLNRDTIRALLSVPPHELGTQETGSLGSQETKFHLINFWESTLIPYQELIADAFTLAFKNELGARFFFKFDNSTVVALKEDEERKAELGIKLLQTHTLNEVRAEVHDKKPLTGGDKLPGFTPQNVGQGLQFFATPPQQIEEKVVSISSGKEKLHSFLGTNNTWWDNRKNFETDTAKRGEQKLFEQVLDFFSELAPVVIASFKNNFRDSIKEKANRDDKKSFTDELDQLFKNFERVYVDNQVPTLQNTQELGYDMALNVPFNLPNQGEQEALRAENRAKRLELMEARSIKGFAGVSETTSKDVVKRIETGTAESQTLAQIAKSIEDYFTDVIPSRAKTIARTEVLTAVSLGQKAAFDDATEAIGPMEKVWISAGDSRVRDSHADVDGERVAAKGKFSNGLEFPRDPAGAPEETINCRCTWLMVPPEDQLDDSGINFTGA